MRTAIDVEQLVGWAVRREYAHLGSGDGPREGGSTWEPVAGILELQCVVDGGGLKIARSHPDADEAIRTLRNVTHPGEYWLVIRCAQACSRPDFLGDLPVVQWVPKMSYERAVPAPVVAKVAANGAAYCPVVRQDNAATIDQHRQVYRNWHGALDRLAAALMRAPERLQSHRVTGFKALPEPWLLPAPERARAAAAG